MVKCEICDEEIKNYSSLNFHLRRVHKIESKDYYDKYLKKENDGKCKVCGQPTRFVNIRHGYLGHCCQYCASHDREAINRMVHTQIERYGGVGGASKELCQKMIDTQTEKYGGVGFASEELSKKTHDKILENYGVVHYSKFEGWKEQNYITKKKNNTLNVSKVENRVYKKILEKYPNTVQSYFSDEYPFACDFYIPELNLYIEYNGFVTHCGHFFDDSNENDLKQLEELKHLEEIAETKKSKNFYKNVIYTWTILDNNKLETAKKNKLNYVVFWNEKEANDYIRNNL